MDVKRVIDVQVKWINMLLSERIRVSKIPLNKMSDYKVGKVYSVDKDGKEMIVTRSVDEVVFPIEHRQILPNECVVEFDDGEPHFTECLRLINMKAHKPKRVWFNKFNGRSMHLHILFKDIDTTNYYRKLFSGIDGIDTNLLSEHHICRCEFSVVKKYGSVVKTMFII